MLGYQVYFDISLKVLILIVIQKDHYFHNDSYFICKLVIVTIFQIIFEKWDSASVGIY